MAYDKQTWATGQVVTANKLNHIEDGIAAVEAEIPDVSGLYTKPNTGIPSTDMASAVQASLAKADSALQEHQDISGKADSADFSHETWEFTLDDDSTVEKEVVLWIGT